MVKESYNDFTRNFLRCLYMAYSSGRIDERREGEKERMIDQFLRIRREKGRVLWGGEEMEHIDFLV
jgi:hypothetical protein